MTRQPDSRTDGEPVGDNPGDNSGDDARQPAYLPNFCSSPIVFGVVLIAALTAIALTLARLTEWSMFFTDLAKTSLLLVWTSLAITTTLCLLRTWLNRFSVVRASVLTFAAVITIIIIVSEIIYWLGTLYSTPEMAVPNTWFPQNHWYFLSSNVVIGSIMTGLVLRYFYVSHQWHRNVESEARTRIHALQARIRPHFLFNSMNTIAELTRTNPKAAEAAVVNLSDLFRASLADSKKLVPLTQELGVTRVYQEMEQQRLGDRLVVKWQLDDLPQQARIPSLTLQPLLENAIYHGIEPLPDKGVIEIEGRSKGKMVYLSVRNPLPINKYKSEAGNQIALENIRERLELAFGSSASLSRAIDQTHYQVSIAFPVKE
ncbi:MAG: histidine kinase [Gammaproteobacteria bacterium]|nr:sensor histidine kinase [Chromatiales bacterium]MDP6673327.1 histidine kinase [Gammaproteobacteria bacterium]